MKNKIVGVDDGEGPPVPIPNTEVKLTRADDTWLEAARDNRKMPTLKAATQYGGCFFIFNTDFCLPFAGETGIINFIDLKHKVMKAGGAFL